MTRLELYGTASCPYTIELRESLHWKRRDFVEYDVEVDHDAFHRMLNLIDGQIHIPVLVQEGKVVQIGWQGRSCVVHKR